MRLSAADCLLRGWSNMLANWELIAVSCLQGIVVVVLFVGGLAIPLFSLGLTFEKAVSSPEAGVAEVLDRLAVVSLPLLLGLLAALILTTLAFLVFSYFQGGLYGTLYSADRQALPGAGRDRRLFRTFSGRNFAGWGGRFVWRFFWFYNFAGLLFLIALLLVLVWVGLTAFAADRWGAPVAWSVGCGGALPVFFVLLVLSLGIGLGQADLPRDGSGVLKAARLGFDVLARRPGAVLLLALCFAAAGIAVSLIFLPVSIGLTLGLAQKPLAALAARGALALLQMIPNAALSVASAAAFVALMRSEIAGARRLEVPPA